MNGTIRDKGSVREASPLSRKARKDMLGNEKTGGNCLSKWVYARLFLLFSQDELSHSKTYLIACNFNFKFINNATGSAPSKYGSRVLFVAWRNNINDI